MRAANKAKSRYLTGISHELRSPLNAILGYAQLLEQDPEVAPRRREALSIIRRSSEYLADLIEGLLDLSRIEAGRLEFVHEEVNLPQVLDQMVNMFRMQAESKGLIFEYLRLSALPERVKTDEKRLRQILINLLSNAVKYTAAGHGRFTVRYRNQVAEFTVEDTGPGIAPEDSERIFRPFERIRRPGQQHIPGTGLGLTITKLLSELMGGELTLTSEPGKGSRFRVSLMLSSVSNGVQAVHPVSIIAGYEGPPRTLMVVDDEPSHRRLLLDIMTPLGFKLIEASDGPDCLEKLKFNRPDAFLPDLSMPGMNGWELARIGYPSALRQRLDALKTSNRLRDGQARLLNDFVQRFDFAALIRTLEEMP